MASPQLLKSLEVYNKTLEALERAEDNVQKALEQLKKFAGKATFEINGTYYQIRKRGAGFYLCELNGAPHGRPRKKVPQEPLGEPLDMLALSQVPRVTAAVAGPGEEEGEEESEEESDDESVEQREENEMPETDAAREIAAASAVN